MTEAEQYVWTEIEKGGREINNQNETEGKKEINPIPHELNSKREMRKKNTILHIC